MDIIEQARSEWPIFFALTEIDAMTGNAIRRRTIKNMRSRGEIPEGCFSKIRRKIIVNRDSFLDWYSSQIS